MGRIDPEQERARLAARYAAMTDLELQKVGRDPAALTEWARSAFLKELKKRGLVWAPEAQIAKPIAEGEILNLLEVSKNRNEAGLVRDFLAQKGMKAYLLEESSGDNEPSSSAGRKETRGPSQGLGCRPTATGGVAETGIACTGRRTRI
jgi:hypothetical protein